MTPSLIQRRAVGAFLPGQGAAQQLIPHGQIAIGDHLASQAAGHVDHQGRFRFSVIECSVRPAITTTCAERTSSRSNDSNSARPTRIW